MMQTEEKVKTTTTGGRKRAHLVKFFLNDEEYEKLLSSATSFGARARPQKRWAVKSISAHCEKRRKGKTGVHRESGKDN